MPRARTGELERASSTRRLRHISTHMLPLFLDSARRSCVQRHHTQTDDASSDSVHEAPSQPPTLGPTYATPVPSDYLLPDSRATGLYQPPRLLSNQQMATFIARGFLSLAVDDVAPEVHEALHKTAECKWIQSGEDNGAGLGNNIWPAVPQLGSVLRSGVVHGGLQSILGEGYTMNAHRHMHNSSTQGDQAFHKDTDNRGAYTHRPRSIIIF